MSDKRIIEEPASEEIFHDDWLVKDSPLNETTKIQASVFMALVADEAKDGMVPYAMLATEWTALTTYYKDQVVIYNGELYRAKDTNVSPTFNPSAWTKVSFDTLYRTTLADVKNSICEEWSTSTTYTLNDCAIHEDKLYKCIADTATVGTWVSSEWELVSIYEMIQNLPKSASDVTYDNTESGLESDNVQDALDEVAETITELSNTTEVTGTASGAIATFTDGADAPLKELKVAVTPYQDLHGQDAPWAGGAGKNKLPTFEGNPQTINGVTFTPQADGSVICNGTASATTTFSANSGTFIWDGTSDYWLSGCPDGGSGSTFALRIDNSTGFYSKIDNGSGVKLQSASGDLANKTLFYTIIIRSDYTCNNLLFKPMLNAGLSAETYEPYSNICPIIGWDEAVVTRTGKNLWGGEKLADDIVAKVPQAAKDTTNKTVTYHASQVTGKVLFDNFKENTQYTIYLSTSNQYTNIGISYADGSSETIAPNTYKTTLANKTITQIVGRWATGSTVLNYEECGVFEGVITAEDFEPYNGATYTIDLNGTRYGGTLDVVSGVLTVNRKYLYFDGTDYTNWRKSANYGTSTRFDYLGTKNIAKISGTILSNYLIKITIGTNDAEGMALHGSDASLLIQLHTDRMASDDVTGLMGFFTNNPLQVVYELATPIIIQLTPTQVKSLLQQNNVWADCGDINNVEYVRNLNITINDLLSRING